MKKNQPFLYLSLLLLSSLHCHAQTLDSIIHFHKTGLQSQTDVMRRDPSDIIKVDGKYFVWYSKRLAEDGHNLFPGDHNASNGYHADIWYATSTDGKYWTEKSVCIEKGGEGDWDEQSAFTPNILVWKGKYYLYYTGVPKPFTNDGDQVTKSAIGLAVADSPDGPWKKLSAPILMCSNNPNDFDSMRIDDACLIVRKGKIYLYYKGRQWNNTPANTKLGLATADDPEGSYIKHSLNPIIKAGHEVMVWHLNTGVVAMINIGPEGLRHTLQYAPDGIHFSTMQHVSQLPSAAGFYWPEAFTDSVTGRMPDWGIEIVSVDKQLPGLGQVDLIWKKRE